MAPQGRGSPQQGRPQTQGLEAESSVQTEPQLLQNLITKLGVDFPDHASINELGDYLATGFCEPEEVDLINDYQYHLKQIRRLKKQLGLQEKELTSMEIETVTRMIMISQSSKSKGGRGVNAVRTETLQKIEDLYEKQELGEEEEGLLDGLMGKLDGKQVVGDQNVGNYTSQDKRRF